MELIQFLALTVLFLILVFLFLFIFRTLIREQKAERELAASQIRMILASQSQENLITLLGKTVTLLSVKDPLSFQAVQAMNSTSEVVVPKDNSDQGEYLQWIDDNPELNDTEKELLREVNYE